MIHLDVGMWGFIPTAAYLVKQVQAWQDHAVFFCVCMYMCRYMWDSYVCWRIMAGRCDQLSSAQLSCTQLISRGGRACFVVRYEVQNREGYAYKASLYMGVLRGAS